jgi:hypothetical protein
VVAGTAPILLKCSFEEPTMPTRSERFKADEERKAQTRTRKNEHTEAEAQAPNGHVAKKATYARETPRSSRPSRKSTRKSANRARNDAARTIANEQEASSPKARFERKAALDARARGAQ